MEIRFTHPPGQDSKVTAADWHYSASIHAAEAARLRNIASNWTGINAAADEFFIRLWTAATAHSRLGTWMNAHPELAEFASKLQPRKDPDDATEP